MQAEAEVPDVPRRYEGESITDFNKRLLKHYTLDEITPGSPSQAPRAGRDRDCGSPSSPNCPSDVPEPSDYSD